MLQCRMSYLTGVIVLDATRLLPGAFCTQILADLGARVIKIEDTGQGDYMRYAPPYVAGESAFFRSLNRGKESIRVNLKHEKGKGVLLQLVKKGDVFVESFRPGVLERLGAGFRQLSQVNSKLIYCAITGYGQTGPRKDQAGHDCNYMALAGALHLMGKRGGPPIVPGLQIADMAGGGMFGVIGILAALHKRGVSGEGSFVDTAMAEGALFWVGPYLGMAQAGDPLHRGDLPLSGKLPNYEVYETKDGRFMALGALEPKFWQNFLRAAGLGNDPIPGFLEAGSGEAREKLEALFKTRTQAEWVELLKGSDACCEPVEHPSQAVEEAQFRARGMFVQTEGDDFVYVRAPVADPMSVPKTPPPKLGEQTDQVLLELGFSPGELAALRKEGAVA